jgi:hypothetical protein
MTVSHGFSGCHRPSFSQMSSSVWSACQTALGPVASWRWIRSKASAYAFVPLAGQGHQARVQTADHGVDGAVARRGFPELFGESDDLAMDGRRGQGLFLQGEALDNLA